MTFPAGLNPDEHKRLVSTLTKLIKYVDLKNTYFVGGLVVRYYVEMAGLKYNEPRNLNDIDIVLSTPEGINPSVTKEFKVHHYHETEFGMYLVLVDPENTIKIDIGDNRARPVIESTKIEFENGQKLLIPTLEDQFVEIVRDCYRVVNIEGFKNKAHYYTDAKILRKIADMEKAQEVYEKMDNTGFPNSSFWKDKVKEPMPALINDVYEKAMEYADQHPESIITIGYSQATGASECPDCIKNSLKFPLTPQEEIFKIMGW